VIGTLLDLPSETLDIIEHDKEHKSVPCCNAMWEKWVMLDSSASWEKLFRAIESTTISNDDETPKKGD